VDDRSAYVGMLRKTQSLLTWGEISKENIAEDKACVPVASAKQGIQGQGEEKLHNRRRHGLQRRKHKQPNKKEDLTQTQEDTSLSLNYSSSLLLSVRIIMCAQARIN